MSARQLGIDELECPVCSAIFDCGELTVLRAELAAAQRGSRVAIEQYDTMKDSRDEKVVAIDALRAELAEAKALASIGNDAVVFAAETGECLFCARPSPELHDEDCPVGEYVKEHPQ